MEIELWKMVIPPLLLVESCMTTVYMYINSVKHMIIKYMHTAQWLLKAVIHFMIISNMTLLCLTAVPYFGFKAHRK